MTVESKISEVVQANAAVDDALRQIMIKHFNVDPKEAAGHNAYALLGVEVGISIANMFLSLKHPNSHRHYRALCDTTYHLNTNEFWTRNATVLLPLIHVALNAYRDGASLQAERLVRNEYASNDSLIVAAKAAPLEIFPVIAYLIGGPVLMVSASLPLKQELAPYFLG